MSCCNFQITRQTRYLCLFGVWLRHAKDRGRVNGGRHRAVFRWKYLATVFGQAKLRSEQILRGGCAQADDYLGMNRCNLHLEPRAAGSYFECVWLLVETDFAPWLPLEMLDRVGDIHLSAIDACRLKALIKKLTGGPNERFSLHIFAITRLFPNQEDSGMGCAFAKDDLGRFPVHVASATVLCRCSQAGKIMACG
jgi:hypothetical protein